MHDELVLYQPVLSDPINPPAPTPPPETPPHDQQSDITDPQSAITDPHSAASPSPHLTCAPSLSAAGQRELDALVEAIHCPVRRRILLDLAAVGRANVALLAQRTGIAPPTLSHHLATLKMRGILFSERQGKQIWYTASPDRIRCHRPGRQLHLTLASPDKTVSLTLTLGPPEPPNAQPAHRSASQ
jgi:ArsR family transcriptional regulator, lead/cadmium/zinc/bismuth-responsive transcriptional repressor